VAEGREGNTVDGGGSETAAPKRRLRILFVVQPGALLRFALLIPALAERGHDVHIAFSPGGEWRKRQKRQTVGASLPQRTVDLAEELRSKYPRVTYGPAPLRPDGDGWSEVATLVRGFADLAHNANPRYANAPHLRKRTRQRILNPVRKGSDVEPIGRWLALRYGSRLRSTIDLERSQRVLGITARMEDAIPSSKEVDRCIRELAPDIVVATGTFRHMSTEVEVLKSARRLGIPTGIFVTSWDNLTNKGSLKFTPELVFVWNDVQVRDAVELHRIPRERIRTVGAHVFDEWFARTPTRTREELLTQLGLDPAQPYLVYLCSSGNIATNDEHAFVDEWLRALRASTDERLRRINVVVRPHPNAQQRTTALPVENAVVWPVGGAYPVAADARADFFDTLFHSSAVVGINTTAMIEAAIVGKSVLTVLVGDFDQQSTLHFRYLLTENGGFLHVAPTLEEHLEQLGRVLDEDAEGAERRRRFVESFVRPGGIDRPAAPIGAAAIEELADLPVQSGTRPGTRALRAGLSVEAALNRAYASYRRVRTGGRSGGEVAPHPRETPG